MAEAAVVPVTETFNPLNLVVTTRAQSSREVLKELPFFGVELETGRARLSKSKAERRREKWKGTARLKTEEPSQPSTPVGLDLPPDYGTLQKEDPTLKPWFEKVTEVKQELSRVAQAVWKKLPILYKGGFFISARVMLRL